MSVNLEDLSKYQEEINSLKEEINSLKKEREQLIVNLVTTNNKMLLAERQINEKFIEDRSTEWENIAQTISHTMKGPNNIIVNKISEIINKEQVSDEIKLIMKTIEAEAKYSNDIIGLFDIIRKGSEFKTESISLSDIISMIKNSEQRCITLAINNASELSKDTLERLKGCELYSEIKEMTSLELSNIEKADLDRHYKIHKMAFSAIIDELILNMFRHAKNSKKPEPYSHLADKPEIFAVDFHQQKSMLHIIFRNSSRLPIYKSWQIIEQRIKSISLPKKSFGLYLASIFSKKHSKFPNISFYDLDVPENDTVSEIIITLKES